MKWTSHTAQSMKEMWCGSDFQRSIQVAFQPNQRMSYHRPLQPPDLCGIAGLNIQHSILGTQFLRSPRHHSSLGHLRASLFSVHLLIPCKTEPLTFMCPFSLLLETSVTTRALCCSHRGQNQSSPEPPAYFLSKVSTVGIGTLEHHNLRQQSVEEYHSDIYMLQTCLVGRSTNLLPIFASCSVPGWWTEPMKSIRRLFNIFLKLFLGLLRDGWYLSH